DDHDDRALADLVLPWPLDLAELADRLGDEPLRAGERQLAAAGLARRVLKGGPDRRLTAAAAHRVRPRLPAAAALRPAGSVHYRVCRCGVWRLHQRQYFLRSTRSGVLRFDFIDS